MRLARPTAARSAGRLAACALLAAAGLTTGCAVRPGYVDATTGRVYAGYAKPACYATDLCGLCGVKECDCRREPYTPSVAAFTSYPGLSANWLSGGRHGRRPPLATTHVYAPPPARYENYPGHANRSAGSSPASGPKTGRSPAERDEPAAAPAPMPLPASLAPGPGLPEPGLPETDVDGIGE